MVSPSSNCLSQTPSIQLNYAQINCILKVTKKKHSFTSIQSKRDICYKNINNFSIVTNTVIIKIDK